MNIRENRRHSQAYSLKAQKTKHGFFAIDVRCFAEACEDVNMLRPIW